MHVWCHPSCLAIRELADAASRQAAKFCGVSARIWLACGVRLPGQNEEEYADNEAQREVQVIPQLGKSDPHGRCEHEGDAETVQEAFFITSARTGVPVLAEMPHLLAVEVGEEHAGEFLLLTAGAVLIGTRPFGGKHVAAMDEGANGEMDLFLPPGCRRPVVVNRMGLRGKERGRVGANELNRAIDSISRLAEVCGDLESLHINVEPVSDSQGMPRVA